MRLRRISSAVSTKITSRSRRVTSAPQPTTVWPRTRALLWLNTIWHLYSRQATASIVTISRPSPGTSKRPTRVSPVPSRKFGYFYQCGFGVKRDYSQALTWYRRAADHGKGSQNAHETLPFAFRYWLTTKFAFFVC